MKSEQNLNYSYSYQLSEDKIKPQINMKEEKEKIKLSRRNEYLNPASSLLWMETTTTTKKPSFV